MSFRLTNYIAFQVKDYEKAVSFYENILGWEKVTVSETETSFKTENMHLFVEKKEEETLHTFFELETTDMNIAKEKLLQAGCEITKQYSDKSLMMKDAFGLYFHLFEKGAL